MSDAFCYVGALRTALIQFSAFLPSSGDENENNSTPSYVLEAVLLSELLMVLRRE